jgi:hypothetical protein
VKKKEMKTTTRLIGVVAIAMALTMVLSAGAAVASRSVDPTPQTSAIDTLTIITCIGQMSEEEHLDFEISSEDLINNPPLADEEVVGAIRFDEVLKVTDGTTQFVKDLGIDTRNVRNLDIAKSIGYTSMVGEYNTIGTLSLDEDVGMSCLPASCEEVKAGSSMVVTEAKINTRTKVGITEMPVALEYGVDATGLGGSGTLAVGRISAHMDVFVEDGRACGEGDLVEVITPFAGILGGFGMVQQVDPETGLPIGNPLFGDFLVEAGGEIITWEEEQEYPLGSVLEFTEDSTANGLFEFHKSMSYESVIRP